MPNCGGDKSLFWFIFLAVVAADLVTKLIAVTYLSPIPQPVLGRVLQWQLVFNPGAAFGMHVGSASRWVFGGLAVVALIVMATMVRATPPGHRARLTGLGLVCGGAVGNLVDRIRSPRGVIDFIDLGFGGYRWPTFNLADVGVITGAAILSIVLVRESAWVAATRSDD